MANEKETLSGLFAPPRSDLRGVGGVLCGFSADSAFLNQALMRFTRVASASRSARGSVDLTLMLDPGHPVSLTESCPGILQLRAKNHEHRGLSFRSMHAKVALLGYGPARAAVPTHFRLIVGTANWTIASAREQIELVWHTDFELKSAGADDLRDLGAIAIFFQELLKSYQAGGSFAAQAERIIEQALCHVDDDLIAGPGRFLSTLPQRSSAEPAALLNQLVLGLKGNLSGGNFLVCGSGSFEQLNGSAAQPDTFTAIEDELVEAGILTKSAQKIVIANLECPDQLLASIKAGTLKNWMPHKPKDPVATNKADRTKLHAKFLLVAKEREQGLSGAKLYLGSGNLSKLGFVVPPPWGNVEAGVLLHAEEMTSISKLKKLLPLGAAFSKAEFKVLPEVVEELELSSSNSQVPGCPIIHFAFKAASEGHEVDIIWDLDLLPNLRSVEVILGGEVPVFVEQGQATLMLPPTAPPRFIEVRWQGLSAKIACLTSSGLFKREPIRFTGFGSWLDQLLGFPESFDDPAPDDDGEGGEGEGFEKESVARSTFGNEWDSSAGSRDFPAHTAEMLVEAIADRNGTVNEGQASDWLAYLKHLMLEEFPKKQVASWCSLNVNFLEILKSGEGFAPDWRDTSEYCLLIDEISRAWGLSSSCMLRAEK